jgi:hypothetical protein
VPLDREEMDFDVDREVPADKDTQLFHVADNLIKRHLATVDVPLLGVLSFDESESESECEAEEDFMDYEEEEGEGEEDYDEEEEEYDEEDEDDEVGEEDEEYDDHVRGRGRGGAKEELASASKDAELGTTTNGSRQHSRGSVL